MDGGKRPGRGYGYGLEQAIAQDQYRFSLLDSLVTEEVALLE